MKKAFLSLLISLTIILSVTSFAANGQNDTGLTLEEAFTLISSAHDVYCRFYSDSLFTDYIDVNNAYQMKFDQRDSISNTSEYSFYGDQVYSCDITTDDDLTDYLKKTFTSEMAENIKNESRLLFKDGKVYQPGAVFDPGKAYILAPEQMNLNDLIEITGNQDGVYTVQFKYWNERDALNSETAKTSVVKITQTADGFRICDYDDVFIKKDDLAASGYRKYRFTGSNPATSDAPAITVCALAMSACGAILILKRRRARV